MSFRPRKVFPSLRIGKRARCTQIGCNGALGAPKKGFTFSQDLMLPKGGMIRRCEKCYTHIYIEPASQTARLTARAA